LLTRLATVTCGFAVLLVPYAQAAPSVTATDNGRVSPTGLRQYHLVADSDGDGFPGTFTFATDANAHHSWASTTDSDANDTLFLDDVSGAYHTGAGALDPTDPTRAEWDTHALYLESELLLSGGFPPRNETITTIIEPAGLNVGSGRAGTGVYSIDGMAVIGNSVTQTFLQVVVAPGNFDAATRSVTVTGNFIHNAQQFDFEITVQGYIYGDANADGSVSLADLSLLGSNWNQAGTWGQGDFNGDGTVSLADLSLLGANWNQSDPPAPAELPLTFEQALAVVGLPVPEPAGLTLLGLGGLALLGRRRRA